MTSRAGRLVCVSGFHLVVVTHLLSLYCGHSTLVQGVENSVLTLGRLLSAALGASNIKWGHSGGVDNNGLCLMSGPWSLVNFPHNGVTRLGEDTGWGGVGKWLSQYSAGYTGRRTQISHPQTCTNQSQAWQHTHVIPAGEDPEACWLQASERPSQKIRWVVIEEETQAFPLTFT